MDFGQAFDAAKKGKDVRRRKWPSDVTLFGRCASCGGVVKLVRGRDWAPTHDDLWAEDWEIVEETPCKSA